MPSPNSLHFFFSFLKQIILISITILLTTSPHPNDQTPFILVSTHTDRLMRQTHTLQEELSGTKGQHERDRQGRLHIQNRMKVSVMVPF